MDLLSTINYTGSQGCCIPNDLCCEHMVRDVKDLLKGLNSQLEVTLMNKAIMAQNPLHIMKDHWNNCLGKGDMSGGSHRHDHMDAEEKHIIREELRRMRMFETETERTAVKYNQTLRRVWQRLDNDSIDTFLDRNMKLYKLKKTYLF